MLLNATEITCPFTNGTLDIQLKVSAPEIEGPGRKVAFAISSPASTKPTTETLTLGGRGSYFLKGSQFTSTLF